MDIATHAIMGGIIAIPFLADHPLSAAGFALGCTLPDLDAMSRLFGKRAFLNWHQTYTHSLPLILVMCGIGWWFTRHYGDDIWQAVLAVGVGMLLHVLLDWMNTYGVKLLFPLTNRRYSLEWLFFIDAAMILLNALFLVWIGFTWPQPPTQMAVTYVLVLATYLALRFALRVWASSRSPNGTIALIPSALWPWVFLVCRREEDVIETIHLNVISGASCQSESVCILDRDFQHVLEQIPEVRAMRKLTPAYHAVSAVKKDGNCMITCRDLRTTNFKTRFGQLDLTVNANRQITKKVFHV